MIFSSSPSGPHNSSRVFAAITKSLTTCFDSVPYLPQILCSKVFQIFVYNIHLYHTRTTPWYFYFRFPIKLYLGHCLCITPNKPIKLWRILCTLLNLEGISLWPSIVTTFAILFITFLMKWYNSITLLQFLALFPPAIPYDISCK